MVDNDMADLGPGPTRLKTLTHIVLDRILEHLEREAAGHGGFLDRGQLRATIDAFRNNTEDDAREFYRAGWDECLSVIDEVRRASCRSLPFERMMINTFARLLAPPNRAAVPGRELSRRIVPGFLSAVYQMLGPVLLDQYQSRCRELVRIIQTARGNDFDWRDVYEDPTSQTIVNDILVHLSKHFSNFARRRAWMMGVIVSEMPLTENGAEGDWVFGETEFALLMDAMFRPLRSQMASRAGRQRIEDRYGAVVCEMLDEFFADLATPFNVAPLRRAAP